MNLSIGSGRQTAELRALGWVTLDADPAARADIVATVPSLPPAVTGTQWQYIEMIHFIEHLYIRDARRLLSECYQALAPGGRLVMEQPDIAYAAKALLGQVDTSYQPEIFHHMYAFYGDQNGNPLYQHLWGYTPSSMTAELAKVGFDNDSIFVMKATQHWPWRDFRVEAVKHA